MTARRNSMLITMPQLSYRVDGDGLRDSTPHYVRTPTRNGPIASPYTLSNPKVQSWDFGYNVAGHPSKTRCQTADKQPHSLMYFQSTELPATALRPIHNSKLSWLLSPLPSRGMRANS